MNYHINFQEVAVKPASRIYSLSAGDVFDVQDYASFQAITASDVSHESIHAAQNATAQLCENQHLI